MKRLAASLVNLGPRRALRFAVTALLKTYGGPIALYTKDNLTQEGFEIGSYTYGNPTVLYWQQGARLRIGKFCSIAHGVTILLGAEHRLDLVTTYPFAYELFMNAWPAAKGMDDNRTTKGDVVIGNDVWIGYGATILSGVTIHDGAVIGARAVVTKDIEPYSIVAGNPARVIAKRFDQKTIERLLEIKWWHWPREKINQNMHLIFSSNLEGLLSFEDS